MNGIRRKRQNLDYRWHHERVEREDMRELAAVEEFVRVSSEDPEAFLEEWLQPLLRQGLSLDRAYEIVVESVIRPN